MQRVGIVGGGPGGLMTAYFLETMVDSPLRITLFEASDRLGGKIQTPCFRRAPERYHGVRYEAGAAEFYDYSIHDEDCLKTLIKNLGLSISTMSGSAVIMNDHVLDSREAICEHLGREACSAIVRFDQEARNRMPPGEFYHSDHPEGNHQLAEEPRFDALLEKVPVPSARRYLETVMHSDLATEPHLTNLAFGLQNYLMNDSAYMQLYSIVGGNEQLPRELATRIQAEKRLNGRVTELRKEGNQIQVTWRQQAESHCDVFDFVVVALPHNHLASISFQGEALAAAMQGHLSYYHYPAHYLRITLLFSQPFWRKSLSESFWMLDRFGGCCLYDESLRTPGADHGVLGWLIAGDAASKMSALSDDQLIAEAIDSLPSFLSQGRPYFVTGEVHRWIAAVNGCPSGVQPRRLDLRHQPEPTEHPNLFVVGDYLFDSTLNGVFDSASYVAAWIAGTVADAPQNGN